MDIAERTLRALMLCHNYNKWIYETIFPYIGKSVLEIGCGIGNMSRFLLKTAQLVAIEPQKKYTKYIHLDFPQVRMYNYDITTDDVLKLKKYDFDTVVCINVLEHIDDDMKALSNIYNLLDKGGTLVLFVPAHQFLYGALDKEVDHKRRYGGKVLEEKLKKSGFKIIKKDFFNRIGVIGWFMNGRIRKNKYVSLVQLFLYDRFVPVIRKMDNWFNLPFGLDLYFIAEKE